MPGVLGEDQLDGLEGFDGAEAEVAQVSDGRAYEEELSCVNDDSIPSLSHRGWHQRTFHGSFS